METTFTGGATRLWLYAGDPDTSVRTATPVYAERGEIFMNTMTLKLFFCNLGGTGGQIWSAIPYTPDVLALIAAIPQADWAQANVSSKDYIKNKPSLATVATSGSYNDLINKPTIPSGQIQTDWTQTNSSAVDFIKNKPAARSQSSATRALNTIFQVSTTRNSIVRYSVDVSTTVSLTGSQIGRVVLEMATNAAFTTGVQELQSFGNGNSGTLVVGLVLTQLNTACLSGDVPAGNYVRIRTVNVTGVPTFTYISGQEVLV